MPTSADGAAQNLEMVIKAGMKTPEQALHVIGVLITNQVKINITAPYPPASEPGQPPHLRTGGLRQSYRHQVTPGRGRRVPSVSIYSDRAAIQPVPPHKQVVYASYLEFGTSKMAARPHLRPAVNQIRPMIPLLIRSSWAKGVRAANHGSRRI